MGCPLTILTWKFYQRRDSGWIHTLLEEAENERMHLMFVGQISVPFHSPTPPRLTDTESSQDLHDVA